MLDKINTYSRPLRLSIIESMLSSLMFGGGMIFLVPLAVFFGANSLEVGFLNAFPILLGAWFQLGSIRLLQKFKTRKKAVSVFVALQAIAFLMIATIPVLFPQNQVFWLIVFSTLGTIFGAIVGPLWQSWMRSITPGEVIGEYFGLRNSLAGMVVFLTTLGCGFYLQLVEPSFMAFAFAGIFALSFVGRGLASMLFTKIEDPELVLEKDSTTLFSFVKQLKKENFGYFVLFGTLFTFGVSLVGPFFSFYILNDLGFKNNYFAYTLIISAASASALIGMPYWGRIIDKFGTIKVLKATAILAAIYPLGLILIRDIQGLIFLELMSGLIFSGLNLCFASFIYQSFEPKKIIKYSAYQGVLFGTATFAGIILSGYVQTLNFSFLSLSSPFYVICALAVVFRLIVYVSLSGKINEVKQTQPINEDKLILAVLTFEPVRETMHASFGVIVSTTELTIKKATVNTISKILSAKSITKKELIETMRVLKMISEHTTQPIGTSIIKTGAFAGYELEKAMKMTFNGILLVEDFTKNKAKKAEDFAINEIRTAEKITAEEIKKTKELLEKEKSK